jgi:drug/metabolite transporter (DMT)-like permease
LSAVLMLRESPTQWQVVGGALVVIGVWLATWERAVISGQHVARQAQG